jgi:hypothetical protein
VQTAAQWLDDQKHDKVSTTTSNDKNKEKREEKKNNLRYTSLLKKHLWGKQKSLREQLFERNALC